MTVANRVVRYLREQDVDYEVLRHPHSSSSMESAEFAHIPGARIAKSVLLEDERGYLLAVLPASNRLDLGELHRQTNRDLEIASELELQALFEDCEPGAVPPLGTVYNMDTVIDESLAEQSDVYFEAGDHEQLIHVSGETFETLMGDVQHAHFSRHI